MIARTELVRAVGGFDEQLALLADWDLWLRLAGAGRGAATREVLVAYTEHAGNMTTAAAGGIERELARMAETHASLVRAHGGRLGGAELVRWSVGGPAARRRQARRRAARISPPGCASATAAASCARPRRCSARAWSAACAVAAQHAASAALRGWLPYARPDGAAAPIAPTA